MEATRGRDDDAGGRSEPDRSRDAEGDAMLQPERTDDLLRTGGEDGMLPAGAVPDDLRLPVEVEVQSDEGSVATTEAAWREFHARLRAFVSRRIKDRGDAEDIVQKVFLDMHRSLPSLRSRDRLAPWLYRTARNAVVDHYRRPARQREIPSGDTRELDARRDAVSESDAEDARNLAADCLTPMIERLPAAYRQAIELVELDAVSQKAAAEIAGVTLSGMKARVQRARRRLKAALLECCRVELDGRGAPMGCETHVPADTKCGCADRRKERTEK
jgi:RNA polymerase sigma-70 factor (ECF subfamily)